VYKREREREREREQRENKVFYYYVLEKNELPPKNKNKRIKNDLLVGDRVGVPCYSVNRVRI
jgi:hypothetical protein